MSNLSHNADTLIDEIDAGRLRPQRHAVIRALQDDLPNRGELERELIALHDTGIRIDTDHWAERIWSRIKALPLGDQGALRLCLGLLKPDGDVGWHEAEYLILWAREQGCTEPQINRAFHASNKAH